jgi:hypothetical protein
MQKKQNISFLSCWHDGKGRAKGWRECLTGKGSAIKGRVQWGEL